MNTSKYKKRHNKGHVDISNSGYVNRDWRVLSYIVYIIATVTLLVLVFPPYGFSWLAYIALVPATIIAVRTKYSFHLFALNWLMFSLWWGIVAYWVFVVSKIGYIAMSCMAGFPVALGLFIVGHLANKYKWPVMLSLPLIWLTIEILRASLPFGGFGWFTLAQSQAVWQPGQVSRVIQIADLGGWPLVTVFIACVNGCIVDWVLHSFDKPINGRLNNVVQKLHTELIIAMVLICSVLVYGELRLKQAPMVISEGPHVGIVQTNILQKDKNNPTLKIESGMWEQLDAGTRQLTNNNDKAQLDWLVWPENCLPGPIDSVGQQYWESTEEWIATADISSLEQKKVAELSESYGIRDDQLQDYLQQLYSRRSQLRQNVQMLAQASGVYLIVGAPRRVRWPDGTAYNSVYVVNPDGIFFNQPYDKIHLVPFGEYMIFADLFPSLKQWFIDVMSPHDYDYTLTPGKSLVSFKLDCNGTRLPARIVTPICFEVTYARLIHKLLVTSDHKKNADVMINMTNEGWFKSPAYRFSLFQLASLRCIEHRIPMIRCANRGNSGLIDSSGRAIKLFQFDSTPGMGSVIGEVEVRLDSRVTPFAYWGMWPAWIIVGCVLVGLLVLFFVYVSQLIRGNVEINKTNEKWAIK